MRWPTLHSRHANPRHRVLDLLANGLTTEQILEELPDLEMEDIRASLRFASHRLDHPVVAA